MSAAEGARVYARGWRPHRGPRGGVEVAIAATIRATVRTVLGIGRRLRVKIVVGLLVALAYIPAVVYLALVVLLPERVTDAILPGSEAYIGTVITAVVLYGALAVPAALCPDRRYGTLALYLSALLDRDRYLLARLIGCVAVLGVVTVGPALVYLLGSVLLGAGPDGPLTVAARTLAAVAGGVVAAVVVTAVLAALSTLTDRTGTATGVSLLLLFGIRTAVGILTELAGGASWWRALDPTAVVADTARVLGGGEVTVATWLPPLAATVWTAAGLLVVRAVYQRLVVTR